MEISKTEREAMWILFTCWRKSRFVVRPFLGGINAISGEPLVGDMLAMLKKLNSVSPKQDYLALPEQPWLDGVASSPGLIKQFVATPMLSPAQQQVRKTARRQQEQMKRLDPNSRQADFEMGGSVELQLTDQERTGGFQLGIIPEYDTQRMSFSREANTWYSYNDNETVALNCRVSGTSGRLNVLKSPHELGLKHDDQIHMKDLDEIMSSREKLVKDLWVEASKKNKTPGGVMIEPDRETSSWEARLKVVCHECPGSGDLEVEVRI